MERERKRETLLNKETKVKEREKESEEIGNQREILVDLYLIVSSEILRVGPFESCERNKNVKQRISRLGVGKLWSCI